jgi:hypothetical protein
VTQAVERWLPLDATLDEDAREAVHKHAGQIIAAHAAARGNDEPCELNDMLADALQDLQQRQVPQLEEQEVILRVTVDLLLQGWGAQVTEAGLAVTRPDHHAAYQQQAGSVTKEILRAQLQVARERQLETPSVRRFIQSMERPRRHSGGFTSIYSLIRDGRELAESLQQVQRASDDARAQLLSQAIQPYLQLVTSGERCEYTGLQLTDIWRYFRHTWSSPYNSVPGRSMSLLIRDRAHPFHPVIGIAAISSAVMHLGLRDQLLGWNADALIEELTEAPSVEHGHWLDGLITRGISELYLQDLIDDGHVTQGEIDHPSSEVYARLVALSEAARAAHERSPDSERPARIEGDATAEEWLAQAQTPLFRSKRARSLADLLRARTVLQDALGAEPSAEGVTRLLSTGQGRAVARSLLKLAKKERVGISIADITVCGALPPYSHLLGGKLVAMMLTSPEVRALYARRYGGRPSIIASAMAGRAIRRPPELVYLSTTSLYQVNAAQYNRVRVPCERVRGGAAGESIRYQRLGCTSGTGTLQFTAETSAAMTRMLEARTGVRRVNNVFGEGVSPRLRLVREALGELSISTKLLEHGNPRVLYAIPLARDLQPYLRGMQPSPSYLIDHPDPQACTEDIVAYWRERWLSKRADREDVLARVQRETLVHPIQHGARVELPSEEEPQVSLFEA